MTSDVSFRNIQKLWSARRGLFDVVVGSSLGLYVDPAAAPQLWHEVVPIFATHLHDCWPARFPAVATDAFDYIVFDCFPREERMIFLSAVERFLGDLERSTVPANIVWNPSRRDIVIEATQRLVDLMKASLAAPDVPPRKPPG